VVGNAFVIPEIEIFEGGTRIVNLVWYVMELRPSGWVYFQTLDGKNWAWVNLSDINSLIPVR
jgi:hypothetical protein